jgi:E3 ubiquitin-protein ligase TRIP12
MLLQKGANGYRMAFRREGVLHSVQTIAERTLTTDKDKLDLTGPEEVDANPMPGEMALPFPPTPSKKSSIPSDPNDAVVLRARVIQLKYLTQQAEMEEDSLLDSLHGLCITLMDRQASEGVITKAVQDVAAVLSGSAEDISSFELNQSGLIDALILFLSDKEYTGTLFQRLR